MDQDTSCYRSAQKRQAELDKHKEEFFARGGRIEHLDAFVWSPKDVELPPSDRNQF